MSTQEQTEPQFDSQPRGETSRAESRQPALSGVKSELRNLEMLARNIWTAIFFALCIAAFFIMGGHGGNNSRASQPAGTFSLRNPR